MKLFKKNGKFHIGFGFHELAFSIRTTGVRQVIFDSDGNEIMVFPSQKRSFNVSLPDDAAFFLQRYWTNSGYPRHEVYAIDRDNLKLHIKGSFDASDTIWSIEQKTDLPERLRDWLIDDLFGEPKVQL